MGKKGQVIIEAIVSISVLLVGFLGIVTLLTRSLALGRTIADNYVAAYLAGEGVEVVKNLIDTNLIQRNPWNDGLSDGCYEISYDTTELPVALAPGKCEAATIIDQANPIRFSSNVYSYTGTPTNYKRVVGIELIGTEEVKVNSVVAWTTAGGGKFSANMEDHFMRWRR